VFECGVDWKMAVKKKQIVQQELGLPNPRESVVQFEGLFQIDPESRRRTLAATEKFTESVLGAMESRGFSGRDTFSIRMGLSELCPDILNFCEGNQFTAKAAVEADQTRVELKWRESTGVRLEDIATARGREVSELSNDKKAYETNLLDRIERKKGERQIGGAGLGLLLVSSFVDEFRTSFDEKKKEMTAVLVKKRTAG